MGDQGDGGVKVTGSGCRCLCVRVGGWGVMWWLGTGVTMVAVAEGAPWVGCVQTEG